MPYKDPAKERDRQRRKYYRDIEKSRALSRSSSARYREKHSEKLKAQAQTPEAKARQRAYHKRWYLKNQEKRTAQIAKWQSTNSDRFKQAKAAYRKENQYKFGKYTSKYRRKNLLKFAEKERRRRAKKRLTQVDKVDYGAILRVSNGLCGICHKPFDLFGIDFDHIIPLSKGGTHTAENIQATHAVCNRRKGDKLIANL